MRILSVEDSPTTRLFIKGAVDLLGFEFLEASNGKEGLDVIAREGGDIDLILLDRHMPIMDGLEMLKTLKSNREYKNIPISMITVEEDRDEIERAIKMGATNYLIKPFTKIRLISKIIDGLGLEV